MAQKNETKLALAKKQTPAEAQAQLKRRQEYERWEKAESSWMIHRDDVRHRVRDLRECFDEFNNQLEGAVFDVGLSDVSRSLSRWSRGEIVEMVGTLNPLINGYFTMIDELASQQGCDDIVDFNSKLFLLKMEAVETGFQLGTLYGAIAAGCPKEQIDKFERGLTFALASHPRLVKD